MKDAYYFTHDSNAKDDPKCVLLIEQLGLEGYGIYWILVETLREQPDYKYPLILLPAIARRFNTTLEKIKAVVNGYGLFVIENNEFFLSESLIRRMLPLEEKRLKRSLAGKKGNEIRWNKQLEIANLSQCDSKKSLSKEKESKVKESKEDIIYFENPEVNNAFLEYLQIRKKNKCPNTDRVIKRLTEKLREYAKNRNDALEIINKAITCNWKDFYPLKGVTVTNPQQQLINKYPNAETYKREGYDK